MSNKNRFKNNESQDKSPKVHQAEKLQWDINIKERSDLTDKQKDLIDIILDKKTKIVFVNGPAGCSKTFLGVYCGLKLLEQKRVSCIKFVRTIIESASKSLGSLPGDSNLKMEPFLIPLMEKLDEMLPPPESKKLLAEERIVGMPVGYLRGSSLNAQYIIVEEAQNFTFKELMTTITRLGEYSKMIFLFDPDQSDINGKSGALPMFDLFNDESSKNNGIHCFTFTKDDIVRSGILKYVLERIENYKKTDSYKLLNK